MSTESMMWPPRRDALTDTSLCPSCFAVLGGPVCGRCGFDSSVERGRELYEASLKMRDAADDRSRIISVMRAEQRIASAQAASAQAGPPQMMPSQAQFVSPPPMPGFALQQPTPAPGPPVAAPQGSFAPGPPVPAPQRSFAPGPPVAAPQGSFAPGPPVPAPQGSFASGAGAPPMHAQQTPSRPRRSGVQILLLVAGVTLVGVAALFFAVIAYLLTSSEVRSVLLVVAAAAVGGLAVALRRRLPGTAEALATLGIVFFLVAGLLVRSEGLFGSGRIAGSTFAGGYGIVTAALLIGFARVSRLRSPTTVSALILPLSGFFLLGGLAGAFNGPTSWWAAGLGSGTLAALAGLVWPRLFGTGAFGRRRADEAWLRLNAVVATSWSTAWALFAFPELQLGPVISFGLVAVLWAGIATMPAPLRAPLGAQSPGAQPFGAQSFGAQSPGAQSPGAQPLGAQPFGAQSQRAPWLHGYAAAGAGVAAMGMLVASVPRFDTEWWGLPLLAVTGGMAFVALAALRRGAERGPWRSRAGVALAGGGVVFALSNVISLGLGVFLPLGYAAVTALAPAFTMTGTSSVLGATPIGGDPGWRPEPGLALVVLAASLLAALALLGRTRRHAWAPTLLAGLGLVMGAILLPGVDPVVVGLALVTVLAVVLYVAAPRSPLGVRAAVCATAFVALIPLTFVGRHSAALWLVSAALSVAVPLVVRHATREGSATHESPATRENRATPENHATHESLSRPRPRWAATARAILLGLATANLVLAAFTLPDWLDLQGRAMVLPPFWGAIAALIVLALLPVGARALPRADRLVASAVSGVLAVILGGVVAGYWLGSRAGLGVSFARGTGSVPAADSSGPLLSVLLLATVVSVLWQVLPAAKDAVERFPLATVGPLAVASAVAVMVLDAGGELAAVESLVVVVLAASALLVFDRRDARGVRARVCWDAATVLVALVILAAIAAEPTWLPLLVLAVGALVMASGNGEILLGNHPRHHIAWAALPLGVTALWTALADYDTTTVEAYTLPVALLLAGLVALLAWRRPLAGARADGRLALAAAALVVAIAPSVALSAVGASPAGTLFGGVADTDTAAVDLLRPAALLLGGLALGALAPAIPSRVRGLPLRVLLAAASLLALAGTGLVRGVAEALSQASVTAPDAASQGAPDAPWILGLLGFAPSPFGGPLVEVWSALAATSLVIAGLLWVRDSDQRMPRLADLATLLAVLVFTAPALVQTLRQTDWTPAPLLAVIVLGVASVIAAAHDAPPFGRVVRWTSAGAALLIAAAGLVAAVRATGAQPYSADLLAVVAGAALVIGGLIDLGRVPALRSWRALGLGLIVALVPSLLADYGGTTLVRVVLLGIASIAVLLFGFARKLQAPVVLGATVLLLHALAQLWPWVSMVYSVVPWWLWAGLGGALLIVVAATYEKRIRDAKAVARSIRSLR